MVGLFRISRVCGEKVNLPEKRHQPQKGNDVIQRNPSCKVISANAIDGSSELNPDSIHVVVMSSFLEHECRPLSLLKRLYPILTAKGVIIVKVPNFACWNRIIRGRRWCGFRYPDHVNYFTPRTLRRLAQEAGFTVSRQSYLDKFPFSDNMYAILTKRV